MRMNDVLSSSCCKLSCKTSLYATVQTVAQIIKSAPKLRIGDCGGDGDDGDVGVGTVRRALLRAKNTFLHFYSATSFVRGVHSSFPFSGQTKSQPQDTRTKADSHPGTGSGNGGCL